MAKDDEVIEEELLPWSPLDELCAELMWFGSAAEHDHVLELKSKAQGWDPEVAALIERQNAASRQLAGKQ